MKTKAADVRQRGGARGHGEGSGGQQMAIGPNNNNKNDVRLEVTGCTSTIDEEIETLPLCSKQDCLKSIRELNRELAHYCQLLLTVGGVHDSHMLRAELKKSRRRASELAKQNRLKLLPHLRGTKCQKDELEAFEKLWTTFSSCLELMLEQVRKTFVLHQTFPLHSGTTVLVNTGLTDPMASLCKKAGGSNSCQPIDGPSSDPSAVEQQEITILKSDYCDMQTMLMGIHQCVDIKPWAIEPVVQMDTLDCSKSLNSASELSTVGDVSVYNEERHRRRKCIVIVSLILLSVVVFATILGVCIALFT